MGNNLPVQASQYSVQPRTISGALAVRRGENAVFKNDIYGGAALDMEHTDAIVAAEATRINMREELITLAEGRSLAGDDPEANAIVTRKVRALGNRNDWRLTKKFG